ncbi:MAG: shikimate dehydrogenase [Spirochaetes bacterium]|nr:shikimate dehydrogenase [Spirochaetota bacterium]
MKITDINSRTALYCIFGNPVRHSISPVIHNAAFREMNVDAVYLAFEPMSIGEAVSSLKTLGIKGASITIPFKIDVCGHCDEIDSLAAGIGSVNTIANRDGRIIGYNTDGYGAVRSIEQRGISVDGKTCLILGNGGSARAIAFTLAGHGASIIIAGRNEQRISKLAGDIGTISRKARSILLNSIDNVFMESVDIIINTTPIGMTPDTGSVPIDIELIKKRHIVFDIVYAPHETRLLAVAREKGCPTVFGVDMLVMQGARQFEIWTGMDAPIETMRRAAHKHLNIES